MERLCEEERRKLHFDALARAKKLVWCASGAPAGEGSKDAGECSYAGPGAR